MRQPLAATLGLLVLLALSLGGWHLFGVLPSLVVPVLAFPVLLFGRRSS